MALNMPTFYKRTGSAIVFAAIMLVGLLWNDTAFLALVMLINFLCLNDYFKLMKKIDTGSHWPTWLSFAIFLLSFLCFIPLFPWLSSGTVDVAGGSLHPALLLLPVLILLPVILFIVATTSKDNSLRSFLQAFFGLFYITIPMVLLFMMRQHSMILPAALIFMIWSNDTLAYLVGSFIGKTPFSPISPNKTWEGTGGGALLTIVAACTYGYFSHQYRMVDWIALALCATVAGTLGDLVESKLKRIAGVKDSGTLMPGHGGALDRFDSLLIAAPFAAVYVLFVMY